MDNKEELKVFISGSIDIKEIPSEEIYKRLKNIISANLDVLIGDASGLDTAVQKFFASNNYHKVKVYSIYEQPRNCISEKFRKELVDNMPEKLKAGKNNERERQEYKDKQMTEDSDYSFIIWDGKSKGSYNNIIRALELNKKIVVYLNGNKLSKDEHNVKSIESIYRKNNGYNASEGAKYIIDKGVCDDFNTAQLNKFLVKKEIIIRNKDKKIYEPHPDLSEEKKSKYLIQKKYKGKDTEITYTEELLDWVVRKIKDFNAITGTLL